jgi:hypothetical protein
MNEESLRRANAFLAKIAEKIQPGESLAVTPADIGNEIGLPDPLAAARAVRALLARKRLEMSDGRYRLLDAKPVEPGEPESIPRPPRRKRAAPTGRRPADPSRPTYSVIGRTAIDKLIELGREAGTLRGSLRTLREEAREAREAKDEAERRAKSLAARVRDLEGRLEMAESNLRTILAAARGGQRADSVGDAEMDAILGVLRDRAGPPEPSPAG